MVFQTPNFEWQLIFQRSIIAKFKQISNYILRKLFSTEKRNIFRAVLSYPKLEIKGMPNN